LYFITYRLHFGTTEWTSWISHSLTALTSKTEVLKRLVVCSLSWRRERSREERLDWGMENWCCQPDGTDCYCVLQGLQCIASVYLWAPPHMIST